MVKGISRQVIVVHSPDPKLFEQAIFILKDEAVAQGVTDELLLKEAQQAAEDLLAADPTLSKPENRRVLEQVRRLFAENPDIFN